MTKVRAKRVCAQSVIFSSNRPPCTKRKKSCTRTAELGGGQPARTTSLIQPYNRKLSQRSLVRDFANSALRPSSQRVFAG